MEGRQSAHWGDPSFPGRARKSTQVGYRWGGRTITWWWLSPFGPILSACRPRSPREPYRCTATSNLRSRRQKKVVVGALVEPPGGNESNGSYGWCIVSDLIPRLQTGLTLALTKLAVAAPQVSNHARIDVLEYPATLVNKASFLIHQVLHPHLYWFDEEQPLVYESFVPNDLVDRHATLLSHCREELVYRGTEADRSESISLSVSLTWNLLPKLLTMRRHRNSWCRTMDGKRYESESLPKSTLTPWSDSWAQLSYRPQDDTIKHSQFCRVSTSSTPRRFHSSHINGLSLLTEGLLAFPKIYYLHATARELTRVYWM